MWYNSIIYVWCEYVCIMYGCMISYVYEYGCIYGCMSMYVVCVWYISVICYACTVCVIWYDDLRLIYTCVIWSYNGVIYTDFMRSCKTGIFICSFEYYI